MGLVVGVRVLWWMSDDLIRCRMMLVLQKLLQPDDARQYESQFTDDQGLESDQCEESNSKWQECGSLQLQENEKRKQILFGFLAFTASCFREKKNVRRRRTTFAVISAENNSAQVESSKAYSRRRGVKTKRTFFQRSLNIFDRVFRYFELKCVRADETSNAINQQWVNFLFTCVLIVWQGDFVYWSSLRWFLWLH